MSNLWKKIVFWVVVVFVLLPFAIFFTLTLTIEPIANFIAQKTTTELSEKLGTAVTVGRVEFRFPAKIVIEDFLIEDLSQDTLIYVSELRGEISLLQLLEKKIHAKSVLLSRANVEVKIDVNGESNLDIFSTLGKAPKKDDESWSFVYEVEKIRLLNSRFKFNDYRKPQKENSEVFDFSNLALSNINGLFEMNLISENYFEGKVKSLSFAEQSGFELKGLKSSILFSQTECRLTNTELRLPKSKVAIDSAWLRYDSIKALELNLGDTRLGIGLLYAEIYPKDLEPIFPIFARFQNNIFANISAEGKVDNLRVSKINLNYGSQIGYYGDASVKGLTDIDNVSFVANINNFFAYTPSVQSLISNIIGEPYNMPEMLYKVNRISYKGKIRGNLKSVFIDGKINSNVGSLTTRFTASSSNRFKQAVLDGYISTNGLNLTSISPQNSPFGNLVVSAEATVRVGKNTPLEGRVNADIQKFTYADYEYNNINLNGNISKDVFEGYASMNDKNGKVKFHGLVNIKENNREFHFDAKVSDFRPNRLKLTEKYPNLALDFNINANFKGDKIENINGAIDFDSISITNNGVFRMKKLHISSTSKNDSLVSIIESDLINGNISGNYSIAKIPSDVVNTIKNITPILQNRDDKNSVFDDKRNSLGFYIEIEPLKELCSVFDIEWTTSKPTIISGFYNGEAQSFNVDLDVKQLTNGLMTIDNTLFSCYNDTNDIVLALSSSIQMQKQDTMLLVMSSDFKNDSINLFVAWRNVNTDKVIGGELVTKSKIYRENDSLMLRIDVLPTQIAVLNNILDIKRSRISTDFKSYKISNFNISGANQSIKIDGIVSKSEDDLVRVNLDKINLDIISQFLPEDAALSFGGKVTADADIYRVLEVPIVEATVFSDSLIFNNTSLGRLDAQTKFNHQTNSLDFNGTVSRDKIMTNADIRGGYFFDKDSLYIEAYVDRIDLNFVKKFTNEIFHKVGGYGTGNVEIYGCLGANRLVVEANAAVDQGHLKIGTIGTDIYFSDTIVMTKDSILFRNMNIVDKHGNKGTVDGYVAHKYFEDVNFDIKADFVNFLAFDAPKGGVSSFYGQAYATGNCRIHGNDKTTYILSNATSNQNTKIYIPLDEQVAAVSNNFVKFVVSDSVKMEIAEMSGTNKKQKQTSDVNLELNINIEPSAELQLFLDQRSGDMIKASGDGKLRLTYNSHNNSFKIYGNYAIEDGQYNFSFQQAIRRVFNVSEGSTVSWNGDPENPTINLTAIYQTKADMSVLASKTSDAYFLPRNVLVDCIIKLSGNLLSPHITFDLDLPNSDEDAKRALKNIVNTQDMMNREMLYLLAFGQFYNPNQADGRTNAALSLAVSTVGGQLNSLLSQISDKWSMGLNLKLEEDATMGKNNEYGVNINYSPNERIVINSSIGYRDEEGAASPRNQGGGTFAGNAILDFEIEYKLNQSGKLSAKAFNRTNTNEDITIQGGEYTQGVGLVYRESFNSIKQLWNRWKRIREESRANKKTKKEQKQNEKKQK